jgi:hypothetical protein
MLGLKGKDAVRVAAGVKACEGAMHHGRSDRLYREPRAPVL